jgi:hypothetical protein
MAAQNNPKDDYGFINDEVLAFFEFVAAVNRKAAHLSPEIIDRTIRVGDHPIHLEFTGQGLDQALMPAIAHLEIPAVETPELTIHLWDSASSGTELPNVLSRYFDILGEWWKHLGIRGEIKELSNDRILTAYHLGPNIFSAIDLERGQAFYWVKDAAALPYYEIGSPIRTILNWWTSHQGDQFVHGGAVGNENGGVLLVGKGGSGKSTTSLACLEGGLLYASDDYCLVRAKPEPRVFSIYNTAKLNADIDVERFPNFGKLVHNKVRGKEDKALFFLHAHFPEQVATSFPIKAILIPEVAHRPNTGLRPASAGETLAALAPSTLLQLPGSGQSAIKTMSALVREVPHYVLECGTDLAQIPQVIADLLTDD